MFRNFRSVFGGWMRERESVGGGRGKGKHLCFWGGEQLYFFLINFC